MSLVFDGVPTDPIKPGEPFTVAVLVMGEDGEPNTDYEEAVTLEIANGGGTLSGEIEVIPSFGEALFDDVVYNGDDAFQLIAVSGGLECEPSDVIEVEGGGQAGDDIQSGSSLQEEDSLLADVPLLVQRLTDPDTKVVKAKHYAYLLKSRIWNNESNQARLADMHAVTSLLNTLERFADDDDMQIKILCVLQDMFTTTGEVRYTCSNSHGVIKDEVFVRTHHDGATKNWIPACFQCAASKTAIFSQWPPKEGQPLYYAIKNHLPYSLDHAPEGAIKAEAEAYRPKQNHDPKAAEPFKAEALAERGVERLLALYAASFKDEYLREKVVHAVVPLLETKPSYLSNVVQLASNADVGEAGAVEILSYVSLETLKQGPDVPRIKQLLQGASGVSIKHVQENAASKASQL